MTFVHDKKCCHHLGNLHCKKGRVSQRPSVRKPKTGEIPIRNLCVSFLTANVMNYWSKL